MSFSNYLENAILNALFGKTSSLGSLASAPTIHVALFTATPSDTGGGTEAAYTSYARVATAAADWNASSAGVVTNLNAITFPKCTGGSETITHFGLLDASTSGNLLAYGAVSSSLAVSNNITPKANSGDLSTSLD